MNRGIFGTGVLASVVALAFAAPATADPADTVAAACAKQTRAVTTAKKAVAKAQKAKAATPKARKQRAKRVKAAKAKHTRAKKTLASCKKKASTPAPAPAPAPAPVPVPVPVSPGPPPKPVGDMPVLSLAATTITTLQGLTVTVAAPALPADMQYRLVLAITTSGEITGAPVCTKGVTWLNVPATVNAKVLFGSNAWCAGAGTMSLYRAPKDAHPSVPGELVLAIPIVVNPA